MAAPEANWEHAASLLVQMADAVVATGRTVVAAAVVMSGRVVVVTLVVVATVAAVGAAHTGLVAAYLWRTADTSLAVMMLASALL